MRVLAVFNKNKQVGNGGDHALGVTDDRNNSSVVLGKLVKSTKKCVYGCVIAIALTGGQVRAQGSEVISGDVRHVSFIFPAFVEKFVEPEEQRISDSIKFLSSVPLFGEVVTGPNTQSERDYRPTSSPNQGNQTRVSVENQYELTPEAAEHFELLLWLMLFQFLVLFPLGIYFSMCISPRILAKRRRWMRFHQLKANRFHRKNPGKIYRMPRKAFCQWLWF
ncbi:hypothetical protein [Morganella morganii]|uniref:hypothetical protein n=1 Tax=Morganella morganii TaxID=582 RepID=UPI0009070363|nr:hypothetical protein [Morganella morganii]MBT0384905.1 hypothetical protein [Morganella morganii subsp. morganii]